MFSFFDELFSVEFGYQVTILFKDIPRSKVMVVLS
jgi:hypothetical protein